MTSRVEISKRLVLLNTASGVLTRVVNVSVIVWLHQYLLRRIGTEEYQLLPLLMSIIVLLPLFTQILTAGIGRFVLAAYAQGDDRGVTQIVSTMFPLLCGTAAVILAGGWPLAWYIDKVLAVPAERLWDARLMMALLILSAAVKPPCTVFSVGFYVQQKFVLYNAIGVASELLRIFLLFALLFGVSTRVLWVVVANVTAELVMSAVVLVWSKRMLPALRFRVREIQWGRARELMSFGGWNFLGYTAWRLRETAVLLILNRLATSADVAVFNVGYLGRRQVDAWADVMAGPLYPVVTGMHALGAKDRIRAIYMRGGRIAMWAMLMVALPAALYAETIIRLYIGPVFLEAAVVMILTLASLPAASAAWMIWQVSSATGRVRSPSLFILVSQVAIVALASYTVYVLGWGATGVALSVFVVSIVSEYFVLWRLGLMIADVKFEAWVRQTLIPGLTPGCTASVVWAGLNVLVQPQSWMEVGLCTMAGILCYLAVLLAFCLEPGDREDLARVMARLKRPARGSPTAGQPASLGSVAGCAPPSEEAVRTACRVPEHS